MSDLFKNHMVGFPHEAALMYTIYVQKSDPGKTGQGFMSHWYQVLYLYKTHYFPIVLVNTQESVVPS